MLEKVKGIAKSFCRKRKKEKEKRKHVQSKDRITQSELKNMFFYLDTYEKYTFLGLLDYDKNSDDDYFAQS